MKKPLPVGIELFDEIITKDYFYVDKTGFIKELLDYKSKVTLITRPRRFGKTLAMSMLKSFFDMQGDRKDLFDGLKIMQYQELVDEHQNKYPVIFLSLKGVKGTTFLSAMSLLANLISRLYKKYKYLLDGDILMEVEKKEFHAYISKEASGEELMLSLKTLMEYLYTYHQKKVVLLIDEYDSPIDNAELEGFYPEMIKFMRGFLGDALKTNDFIEFGVVTGVQQIEKEGLFSEVNNLKVCNILSDRYADSFGFTEEEVLLACEYYDMPEDMDSVRAFYDGYKFGREEIYNPWSILNYLDERRLDYYWVNTASMGILQNIFIKGSRELKAMMEDLLMDVPVEMQIWNHITYPIKYEKTNAFCTLLLNAGYLKIKDVLSTGMSPKCTAVLVNHEVKEAFRDCIRQWMNGSGNEFASVLTEFIEALTCGDEKGMETALNEKLMYSPSYHDLIGENSFHMYILGILQAVSDQYMIRSNREEREGRADCTMRPHDKNQAAIVIEFKHVKKKRAGKNQVARVAEQGLEQIKEKGYKKDMGMEGYTTIYEYGIAFNNKYCVVKSGKV